MKSIFFISLTLFLGLSWSCKRNAIAISDEQKLSTKDVTINRQTYEKVKSQSYTINNVTISGNMLTVTITSSGCNSNSWSVALIDKGVIAESMPPQRFLKLDFENKELCLAVFTKSYSFDISALQVNGYQQLILNLYGYKNGVVYNY